MRQYVMAANWKMHKLIADAKCFIAEVNVKLPDSDKVEAVLCTSPLFLNTLVKKADPSKLSIGAQTMHFAAQGAYTGEVSPVALADLGVKYVIIGHSERRELYNESDDDVNKKVAAAFANNLIPIICCGESLAEREDGNTKTVVEKQIISALQGLDHSLVAAAIIAYEPIWAIGTGKSSSAEDAGSVCAHIRSIVSAQYNEASANKLRILYGGSVKPDNVTEYLQMEHIDGALVGGASLEAEAYLKLVEACVDV